MARINPHINFNGNAEEAFNFYKSVFGGEFTNITRFRDIASPEFPVSEKEADLKQLKISVKSPIGAALLGRSKGEKITIQIPAGAMDLEILDISI